MQQKTEVKKRANKAIVLETQSDEMFRSGTGLLKIKLAALQVPYITVTVTSQYNMQ
jgi:hypothetical protein